jgi:type II secretory pathway pseudopilin PulG
MVNRALKPVEMVAIVLVIGALLLMAVLSVRMARANMRDAVRLSHVRQIQTGMQIYFSENNAYPEGVDVPLGTVAARCLSSTGVSSSCSGSEQRVYLSLIPAPPRRGIGDVACGDVAYSYCYDGSENGFSLEFELETRNRILGLDKGVNCLSGAEVFAGVCPR